MKSVKFLGVCILISSILIALSIFYTAYSNRYKPTQIQGSIVNSETGTLYIIKASKNTESGYEFSKVEIKKELGIK